VTRGQNLFDLASVCNVPPQQVDGLAMGDFVQLLAGINQQRQSAPKPKATGR
jgi:hypothetical protein